MPVFPDIASKILYDVWDSVNHVLKIGATIQVGDVEIGAVEIKNATDDTRAAVGAHGLHVDVQASSGIGALAETAPASDTASSGLNGRLQRIAQHLTSLIALLPNALSAGGGLKVGVVDALPAGDNNIGNVDIATQPALEAATVTEYNVALTNANTEYSQALPANCRKIVFRCRTAVDIRYAWVTNKVAAPTSPYQTLKAGADYAVDGIKLAAATLYFASATAGVVVEMEAWT